jgi:hypothetical protein
MNTKPFTTQKISGAYAIASLIKKSRNLTSSQCIRIFMKQHRSTVAAWLQERRAETEEYECSEGDRLGDWPIEIVEKGTISLHRDFLMSCLTS